MAKVAAESGERKRRRRACHQDVWHPRTSGSLDDVLEQPDVVVVGTEYREPGMGRRVELTAATWWVPE